MRNPPDIGLYISTTVKDMSIVVEDVNVVEDKDLTGFFLVTVVDEEYADDIGAIGQEFTSDEWFAFVSKYSLKKA